MKHNQERASSLATYPSTLEREVNKFAKNWNSKDNLRSSKDVPGNVNVSSSLPSSPLGNISTSSSPKSLENGRMNIIQENLMSPLGSPSQISKIHVIKL